MTLEGRYFDGVLKLVVDSVPSPIFLVDDDMRILDYNTAASELLVSKAISVLRQRGGEALHCLHAFDVPEGCGRAKFCKDCVIRNSVGEGIQGKRVVHRQQHLELVRSGQVTEIDALITASPFPYRQHQLVFLVIEPISEAAGDKSHLPLSGWSKLIPP